MGPHTVLQILGQTCQALCRKRHDHFRCGKSFPLLQGPGKFFRHEAKLDPGLIELIHAGTAAESSAVYKLQGIAGSCPLRSTLFCQNHQGIDLMGRLSAPRSDLQFQMRDRRFLGTSLHGMAALESDQVVFSGEKINICTEELFKYYCQLGKRAYDDTSGDNIQLRKDPVQKCHLHKACCIFQYDLQSLRLLFLSIDGRKPLQCVFPVLKTVAFEAQITGCCSVPGSENHRRAAHIPGS